MFIISWLLFSSSVVSDSLRPHGPQHTRLPCPSLSSRVFSNSCPLSQWCHLTISSSVVPLSSCLRSFPASGAFPMSQFFSSGGQSIGATISVLPMSIQGWFPLGLTGYSGCNSPDAGVKLILLPSSEAIITDNTFIKDYFQRLGS